PRFAYGAVHSLVRGLREVCSLLAALAFFFFLNDRAPPEISPLPLPDPFPILAARRRKPYYRPVQRALLWLGESAFHTRSDRKSTRLNSSHPSISYAVFCL